MMRKRIDIIKSKKKILYEKSTPNIRINLTCVIHNTRNSKNQNKNRIFKLNLV